MNEELWGQTPEPMYQAPVPMEGGGSMYDRLKNAVYNPWFQLGMGMIGGNTGATRAEARANAFSGGLRAAQGAQQYRYQEAENARAQAKADREQKEFENALASEAAFKKFATSMLEKNPGSVFWESSVINPKWGMEYFKAQSEDEYRKMQAAASQTQAAASMMNAVTNRQQEGRLSNPMLQMQRELDWYGQRTPEERRNLAEMKSLGKVTQTPTPTAASKEFKATMDSVFETDPSLAGPRGDGWNKFQSGDWEQKKQIASEIAWSLVHQNGMDPMTAAAVATERVWGKQATAAPKGREGYSAVPKGN